MRFEIGGKKLIMLFGFAGLHACGGDVVSSPNSGDRRLPLPNVRSVGPTEIAAGMPLTILGSGFMGSDDGQTMLSFDGQYVTAAGNRQGVHLQVKPEVLNQGVLRWAFGPNIPFSQRNELGTFVGTLRAQNAAPNKVGQTSAAVPVELRVQPSIVIEQIGFGGASCPADVADTTEQSGVSLTVKAVGLKAGEKKAPLRFIYSFMRQQFDIKGYLVDASSADPESLLPAEGAVSLIDIVDDGDTSGFGHGVPRTMAVAKGSYTPGILNTARWMTNALGLSQLYTMPPADPVADYQDAILTVVAIDRDGTQAQRQIPLRIWSPLEISYSGQSRVARSFDPEPISGCLSGGSLGLEMTYQEQKSETRKRTFSVNASIGGGLEFKVVKLNAEFGMDVTAEVSSATANNLGVRVILLPREFGVVYRQTLQLQRKGQLISHGKCGQTTPVGDVVVTDWVWSPDVAKGKACPPLPKSNLSPGQIYPE